ncbi:MAG TPA: hypothetical protein VMU04_25990 [Candidatus Acidoferrum sp.]|nr:hypothetical protein [Candidatus Acidoferrum sp.]
MNEGSAVKVLIVNDDGQYLSGTATEWEFTDDRTRAKVFDFVGDRVAEQIELVRRVHGRVWIAVKLDPLEIYEFCDRCGCRMRSFRAYYDGKQFLCADCRNAAPDAAGSPG